MEHEVKPLRSLDARYYTDPDVFRMESARLFARTWQFADHVSQVEAPGDYFTFSAGGENLFCIRGGDGEIRAFYDVYQHRAHELISEDSNAKLLVCPYHVWTYELTGDLRSCPNIKSVPGFDRSEICLTPVRIENFHGFLFANFDPNAKPMESWFPRVREEMTRQSRYRG